MLAFWLFIIFLCSFIYLEFISNIQCYLWLSRIWFVSTRNTMKILPNTVLTFIMTYNSSGTTLYNDFLSNIQCQILL